ncbi:MAG TPA: hypothetical protein VFG56_02325 [Candidatus Saccharimonadales bacterium]|nr:hypothetical protein [Candidatus Saccharimonadales bacterium]
MTHRLLDTSPAHMTEALDDSVIPRIPIACPEPVLISETNSLITVATVTLVLSSLPEAVDKRGGGQKTEAYRNPSQKSRHPDVVTAERLVAAHQDNRPKDENHQEKATILN